MTNKATTCKSPFCALSPCRTPAGCIVATDGEVPLDCPNRRARFERPGFHFVNRGVGDAHLTPAAAATLSTASKSNPARAVRELLAAGKLILLEPRVRHPLRGGKAGRGVRASPAADVAEQVPPAAGALETWVKFKVVDDATGRPIPGVVLRIRLPNGNEQDYTTRAGGLVEIDEIDPGMCAVSCDRERARLKGTYKFVAIGEQAVSPPADPRNADRPAGEDAGQELPETEQVFAASESIAERKPEFASDARILVVEEHKVQTGESLKGIAEANGMTWQELAEFNWDTSVPDEINEHLRDDVGCTAKTADGFNYVFRSEDEPGIVYVPKPWERDGLGTEQTHTIRTRTLRGLRCWIRLDVDPMDVEAFDDRFVLLGVDDAYRVEKTIKDDQIPGDRYVDLRFSGLRAGGRYSLQVFESEESQPRFVFESVLYEELAGLSPAAGEAGDDDESEPSPGPDDAYPEDSDVDEEELADAAGEGAAD